MNNNIIKKLTSRKFIIAAITAIAGIITLFVGDNEVVHRSGPSRRRNAPGQDCPWAWAVSTAPQ